MPIPSDPKARKGLPLYGGVLRYFPDALAAVARVSLAGNEQHHPGEPLHWDKTKSMDHEDALLRHLIERGSLDADGLPHTAKVAWRALALLQTECEEDALDEALVLERGSEFRTALNVELDAMTWPPEMPSPGMILPRVGSLAAEQTAQADGAGDYGNPITPRVPKKHRVVATRAEFDSMCAGDMPVDRCERLWTAGDDQAYPWPDSLGPWPGNHHE